MQKLRAACSRGTPHVSTLDLAGENVTNWAPGGDLEGVTVVDPQSDLVYLGREHPDGILEFDLTTGTLTGNSWDLTPWMTGANNQGLEALTYVDGHFYAGHQGNGNIFVFELFEDGTVNLVDTFGSPLGRTDLSGLHYEQNSDTLYAIYDSSNLVVEMTRDGSLLNEYSFPANSDNQEGIALLTNCSASTATIFIAEDAAELWRYGSYPITCVSGLPICDDDVDNDQDGFVDWDGAGVGEPDPHCSSPLRNSERRRGRVGCGIGFELALPVWLFSWAYSRKRR